MRLLWLILASWVAAQFYASPYTISCTSPPIGTAYTMCLDFRAPNQQSAPQSARVLEGHLRAHQLVTFSTPQFGHPLALHSMIGYCDSLIYHYQLSCLSAPPQWLSTTEGYIIDTSKGATDYGNSAQHTHYGQEGSQFHASYEQRTGDTMNPDASNQSVRDKPGGGASSLNSNESSESRHLYSRHVQDSTGDFQKKVVDPKVIMDSLKAGEFNSILTTALVLSIIYAFKDTRYVSRHKGTEICNEFLRAIAIIFHFSCIILAAMIPQLGKRDKNNVVVLGKWHYIGYFMLVSLLLAFHLNLACTGRSTSRPHYGPYEEPPARRLRVGWWGLCRKLQRWSGWTLEDPSMHSKTAIKLDSLLRDLVDQLLVVTGKVRKLADRSKTAGYRRYQSDLCLFGVWAKQTATEEDMQKLTSDKGGEMLHMAVNSRTAILRALDKLGDFWARKSKLSEQAQDHTASSKDLIRNQISLSIQGSTIFGSILEQLREYSRLIEELKKYSKEISECFTKRPRISEWLDALQDLGEEIRPLRKICEELEEFFSLELHQPKKKDPAQAKRTEKKKVYLTVDHNSEPAEVFF